MGFVFVLGGARSGKSAFAVRLGVESRRPVSFVATATPGDGEMTERIQRHRRDRPAAWKTVEEPLELGAAIAAVAQDDFVIVDCLTLWVSNLLGAGWTGDRIHAAGKAVAHDLAVRDGVVVSNEVGLGIVPANALARDFRDLLGGVNASFAAHAHRAVLMVAGRALELA